MPSRSSETPPEAAPPRAAAPGPPLRVEAEVVEARCDGGACQRLLLRVPGWPGFAPGQFAMLSPGPRSSAERSDPLLPRPMAIYRVRGATSASADVEILYKVTGRGTALLAEAAPGDRVGLLGPLGRPFPEPGAEAQVLLVGGGTGIASLFELAARSRAAAPRVLLGARSAAELMGGDDFAALGVPLRIATDDGSAGTRGLVTDLLEQELAGARAAHVFACGPTPMMRRAAELTAAAGGRCTVALENRMACGFGVCLGCAAPLADGGFALVCRDGPTFDAAAVDWKGLP